jgi:hypothetical protein
MTLSFFPRPRALAGLGAAAVPLLVLLAGAPQEDTPAQRAFRAWPYNRSYELMTCAVGAACGLAACLEPALGRWQAGMRAAAGVTYAAGRGLANDAGAALGVFLVVWPLAQTILNSVIGCAGAAVLWCLLALLPAAWAAGTELTLRWRGGGAGGQAGGGAWGGGAAAGDGGVIREGRPRRCGGQLQGPVTCAGAGLRAVLTVFAIGLLAVPAFLPWSGPPEPFIRWHEYSPAGELLWRGTFVSFAIGNLTAAVLQDPAGLGASYTVFFILQCVLHATVMLVDNRVAAAAGGPNGNPHHAWSEIPGFYFIGTVLALLLAARLRVARRPLVEKSGQDEPGGVAAEAAAGGAADGKAGEALGVGP